MIWRTILRTYETLKQNKILRNITFRDLNICSLMSFKIQTYFSISYSKLLSGSDTKLFAVGDDDQSIYSLEEQEFSNMQDVIKDYDIKIS